MPDFTSALYLGWRHEGRGAGYRGPLSLGRPASLDRPPGELELAAGLASLVGCATGLSAPSTLHLFWDLSAVTGPDVEYFADAGIYPIGRWGLERAASMGARVTWFDHHDPGSLAGHLASTRRKPVVVTDGFCPVCGVAAPLGAFQSAAQSRGGLLVVDDTQALGILGSRGEGQSTYGSGGGGSIRFHSLANRENVVVIASLAKAFGVPVACLLSSESLVDRFVTRSLTRIHCSPPSAAVIQAGLSALERNQRRGDADRLRLLARVREFRQLLRNRGWRTSGGCFPVQTIDHPSAEVMHERLLSRGVRGVLQRGGDGASTRIGFLLTAIHTYAQLDEAARAFPEGDASAGRNRK